MTTFRDVAERIVELQDKKNQDYGDVFASLCEDWGSIALMYPLSIKMARLKTLLGDLGNRKVADESVKDTLMDIIGYAGMGVMALENGQLKGFNDIPDTELANIGQELDEFDFGDMGFDASNLGVPRMVVGAPLRATNPFDGVWKCTGSIYQGGDIAAVSQIGRGKLILLVGVRGVGKTTYKNLITEQYPDEYEAPVSATTRAPREGEVHGEDYFFLDEMEFGTALELGLITEAEVIQGNLYGSVGYSIENILRSGKNAITEIGLKGANSMKMTYGDECEIYYIKDDVETVREQLIKRDISGLSSFFMAEGYDSFDEKAYDICDFSFIVKENVPNYREVNAEGIAAALYSYIEL